MRVAVIGAGGTGGYLGGLLARSGEEVIFIVRGANLAAIRAHGLTVRSQLVGEFTVPVQAIDDPGSVDPVDLVLVCVKAYDTAAAIESIRPLVGPDTLVLSVQNGVDNEDFLTQAIGGEHVIGATVGVSAVLERPGVIGCKVEPAVLRFGELAGGTSARTAQLVPIFRRAGVNVDVHPDIRVGLWEKLIGICAFSGVTTLTRQPLGVVMANPETKLFCLGVLAEVAAVARARGIALPDGTVDNWMDIQEGIARTSPNAYGSMYYDLVAGRRLEVEMLNGAVARLGRECGVPAPLNFAIYAALQPYAQGTPARS